MIVKGSQEPDVLIVAQSDDYHALGVAKAVSDLGGTPRIVDNSDFPTLIKLEHRQSAQGVSSQLTLRDGSEVLLHQLKGVWWRRPQPYKPAQETKHPVLRRFVIDEAREAFLGALAAAVPNFINDVGASRRATHKVAQLDAARRVGLRVPATLVTNSAEAARQFAALFKGGCVYKTFTGCDFGFFETRKLESPDDFAELARIDDCPLILQEHVAGDYDVRATVVGDEVFAAEIHFKHGRHPVDGRVDRVPIREHRLSTDVAEQIVRLVREYGLKYGAVDLRFDSSAGYSFFELNPEGQFLWVEIEADIRICNAMAKCLLRHDPFNSRSGHHAATTEA